MSSAIKDYFTRVTQSLNFTSSPSPGLLSSVGLLSSSTPPLTSSTPPLPLIPSLAIYSSTSSQSVQKLTSFRIQAMTKTISECLNQILSFAFTALKFHLTSNEFRNFSEIPSGTFQTSAQARSVLMKSENLCRRVSSLVDRLGSQYGSQESCESVSSRINLHIPRTSLTDTPLSPLSMGELDTDRISNRIEEVEQDIATYDLVLKIWKSWKNWAGGQIYARQNKAMADDFCARRKKRRIFLKMKQKFCVNKVKKQKETLAKGSFVQRVLRNRLKEMREWTKEQVRRKKAARDLNEFKMRRLMERWKEVNDGLKKVGRKIREFRRKFDRKVLFKYFKFFAIVSMILMRENKQKRIANDFNRINLLKLGFKHISFSVFTNKYYSALNTLALNHFAKVHMKKYFEVFYMNSLTQKRNKIVKETGNRIYRKTHLIKAMRKLYSFCSFSKKHRKLKQDSFNYYTSSLYLKTLVSWQSYHNFTKGKIHSMNKSFVLFRKNTLTKIMKAWKKIQPKLKNLRNASEKLIKEKKFCVMKEILCDWQVLTKNRREKMTGFYNRKNFKVYKKFFNAIREFFERSIEKYEKYDRKLKAFKDKKTKRLFSAWKVVWKGKRGLVLKMNSVKLAKKRKLYKRWRKAFIRKITLTPLVLKRFCLYIFRRWKKYALRTKQKFKLIKISTKHNTLRLKLKSFSKLMKFAIKSSYESSLIQKSLKKIQSKFKSRIFNTWKSFTLSGRIKKLQLEKALKHYEYSSKMNIFQILLSFQKSQQTELLLLTQAFNSKILELNSIKPVKEASPEDLDQKICLKSKGLSRWFRTIEHFRNKSNDISSILSNSLRIEVSDSYFNKQAVEAVQIRRIKTVKKILAHWRQFVDVSKQKHKKSLTQYNKILLKRVKRSFNSIKDFTFIKKKNKKILENAGKQLGLTRTEKFWEKWKIFKDKQKENKAKVLEISRSRLANLMRVILNSWSSYSKYKLTALKIAKNFRTHRLYLQVFNSLNSNRISAFSVKNSKADNFFLSRYMNNWLNYLKISRKDSRIKKELKKKADDFFNDLSCVRALRRLKDFAYNRILLKTANSVFFETSFKKVFSRWKGIHDRYYKKMRVAKMIENEKKNKRKREAVKKWFYVSHLSSWKNRAEKRLFFYWDRRLQRILFTWRDVIDKKKDGNDKAYGLRKLTLVKKVFKGLEMVGDVFKREEDKMKLAVEYRHKSFLKKGFRILYRFHQYSRIKLGKLTKALKFRWFKECTKYFEAWERNVRTLKTKKGKLKKIYCTYIRNYGLKKYELKPAQLSQVSKSDLTKDLEYLQTFIQSLSNPLPKCRPSPVLSIFLKWRGLSSSHLVCNYQKSYQFYLISLKYRVISGLSNYLTYAKNRRKTLRAAIIFHRTQLKKKIFSLWKPKKVIRRRK